MLKGDSESPQLWNWSDSDKEIVKPTVWARYVYVNSELSNYFGPTCLNRRFGYVDFASEEDMQKALELNGKKVLGQELKLDMPRSKEGSQEGKKGRTFLKESNWISMGILLSQLFVFYVKKPPFLGTHVVA